MDYYQGVVEEYLRADRSTFVNPEFCIQLNEHELEPAKGTSWYVDLIAVNFAESTVYLCEVSYSKSLSALLKRLADWSQKWPAPRDALFRDTHLPTSFKVRPWIFIPECLIQKFLDRFRIMIPNPPFMPRITTLEMAAPWRYRTWNRRGEEAKPETIPAEMRT